MGQPLWPSCMRTGPLTSYSSRYSAGPRPQKQAGFPALRRRNTTIIMVVSDRLRAFADPQTEPETIACVGSAGKRALAQLGAALCV